MWVVLSNGTIVETTLVDYPDLFFALHAASRHSIRSRSLSVHQILERTAAVQRVPGIRLGKRDIDLYG